MRNETRQAFSQYLSGIAQANGVADATQLFVAAPSVQQRLDGLTERERQVLELIARGRTNGEIGAALFITDKTASSHVTHILDKLGVSSRVEAALLAERLGLVDPDRASAGHAQNTTSPTA